MTELDKISIPKDWKWVKLEEVCDIISGKNQAKVIDSNGKYPIYGSSGIFGYANDFLCKEGTTVVGRKGTINSPLFVNTKFWNVDTAFGLSPNSQYDNKLLYYFCRSFNFHKLDKSTTIPSLAKRDLLNIDIPLPPKSTQQAIVSKIEELFSELDKGIEQLKTAQQQLKTYRQAVLSAGTSGILTGSSDKFYNNLTIGVPIKYNSTWQTKKLTEVARLESGHTPRKDTPAYWENGNVYWLSLQDIKALDGKIAIDTKYKTNELGIENSSARLLPIGTVCFCRDISVGYVTIMGKVMSTTQHFANWICDKELNNKFLMYAFMASRDSLIRQGQGTTVKTIYMPELKELRIQLPTIEEQLKIVQEIESRLSVADKMEESITQSLQQAEALRQSILKKAFEGRLVTTTAAAIETEKQIAKVVPLERKVLAGKIIHMLHDSPHPGLTKFQKLLYLVENFAKVEYETNFIQERAGPYDKEFTLAFRKEMQENDWAYEEQVRSITKLIPGEQIGSLISKYATYFRGKSKDILFVLMQLKDKTTHDAELIATLYAVWNNRVIKKKPVKIELLIEDFFNWSAKKKEEFQEEEIINTFDWMKKIKFVPSGFGSVIESK